MLYNEEMVSEIKHLGSSDHQVISFKYSCNVRLYLDEHPIRVDGDVDGMWKCFKKYVIEVRHRHILFMRIGEKKYTFENPADIGIMQLIIMNTKQPC